MNVVDDDSESEEDKVDMARINTMTGNAIKTHQNEDLDK